MAVAPRVPDEIEGGAVDLHDREIDLPAALRERPRAGADLRPYQRLVANPFLAVLGLFAWVGALRLSWEARRAEFFLPALLAGLAIPLLFQYHCLDCGRTGHLARAFEHACAHVEMRRQAGRPRRFRGPSPWAQTKLWVVALAVAAFYVWALRSLRSL
jgi:hypothetical protein